MRELVDTDVTAVILDGPKAWKRGGVRVVVGSASARDLVAHSGAIHTHSPDPANASDRRAPPLPRRS